MEGGTPFFIFFNIIEDTIKRKYAGILNKNMMEGNIQKLNNQKQFVLCREMCHALPPLPPDWAPRKTGFWAGNFRAMAENHEQQRGLEVA